MALALARARGQGGNTLNSLHPCPLPQRAPFAAVRRVSPLCAIFCPDCECVCGATGKAHVAPTYAKNTKSQSSNAIAILRGGAAEWTRPAACGRARDMELVPTKEPASHLASRRCPGVLPNAKYRAEARAHFYERRKHEKRQAIQHSDLGTGFRDNPPKSSAGAHEPERLCNQLLSGQENHHS